ncbi:methyltransferase domain-containing protein [Streptomyces sp. NPDC002896]|uniref:class I SAM-dependent methyltransferase n=1 Tax=Streptomyces sp. NPDC002896 TaxID=3154438 RepID=UPI003329D2E7
MHEACRLRRRRTSRHRSGSDRLGVAEGSHLVDLACGTGSLAVQAARRGAVAHGVDVSEEMLGCCGQVRPRQLADGRGTTRCSRLRHGRPLSG